MNIPTRIEIRHWLRDLHRRSLTREQITDRLDAVEAEHGQAARSEVAHFLNVDKALSIEQLTSPGEDSLEAEQAARLQADINSRKKLYGDHGANA